MSITTTGPAPEPLIDPVLPLGSEELQALATVLCPPAAGRELPAQDEAADSELAELGPDPAAEGGTPLRVLPRQRDEFTCPACYLVVHVSRRQPDGRCADCG